jgi:transposase
MTRKRAAYPTDLSDAEWEALAPLVPPSKPGGRPALHERREIVNALAYWLRAAGVPGGCCRMICRPGRRFITTGACGG